MKTRKQHLQKLPLQKRLQAMENIRRWQTFGFQSDLNHITESYSLLSGSFSFYDVRQSAEYWWSIQGKYFSE